VKWLIFALGLAGIFPLGTWLRQNPRILPKVMVVIGALPFVWGVLPKWKIALFGVPDWPGFAQGFDVSALDLILVAVFFSVPPKRRTRPSFGLTFAFYICAVLLSALQAPVPTATLYYVWQLVRMFMTFVVVSRACMDNALTNALLKGLALGVCFQAGVVGWQRFVIHYVQAPGTFTHQNMLGMAMHLVIFPFFSLALAGAKEWQPIVTPILGFAIIIFTTSRASIGFALLGFSFLSAVSLFRTWTARKARILMAAVAVLVLLTPIAYRQFTYRLHEVSLVEEGEGGRTELNTAAEMVLADYPMGIGANNFVVFSNMHGFYQRANVTDKNRTTFPHNIYWTTAAETGYVGLIALMVFLLRPLWIALLFGWRYRNDRRGDLLLGLATSLAIFYVHSYFEWSFLIDQVQYIFAINLGLIAALTRQLVNPSVLRPTIVNTMNPKTHDRPLVEA
jgi:hypothetical protein